MVKRIALFSFLLALLLLCGCGGAEKAATASDAATPTDESPASLAFHLEELPDVGQYRPKQPEYFYGEPLREFSPADDYGALLPYRFSGDDAVFEAIENFGFMTADGKIVTAPVFDYIFPEEVGGKTVFVARKKVSMEQPGTIPDWETDPDGASEAYSRIEEYYDRYSEHMAISTDGKKCLTFRGSPSVFTDLYTGVGLLWYADTPAHEYGVLKDCKSFTVYDSDLNQVAQIASDLQGYEYGSLFAVGKDSFVIEASSYEYDDENDSAENSHELLFFTHGKLKRTLEFGEDVPFEMAGGFIICSDHIRDLNGSVVYEYTDDSAQTVYDANGNCLFVLSPTEGKIVKIDSQGKTSASADVDRLYDYINFYLSSSDGGTCVVVSRGEEAKGYRVFDADLREVCVIGDGDTVAVEFCHRDDSDQQDVFLVASDGETKVLDVLGNTVASVPFIFAGYETGDRYGDADLLYLFSDDGQCAVCSLKDDFTASLTLDENALKYPVFFNRKIAVFTEESFNGNDYKHTNYILDCAAGEPLRSNVSLFDYFVVDGTVKINYIANDTLYVCDGDLNVITSLYDDANV